MDKVTLRDYIRGAVWFSVAGAEIAIGYVILREGMRTIDYIFS